MKNLPIIVIATYLTLLSFEKTGNEVFFKLGSGKEFKFSDIELYDTSTNIMYFKEGHDEFRKFEYDSFTFLKWIIMRYFIEILSNQIPGTDGALTGCHRLNRANPENSQ